MLEPAMAETTSTWSFSVPHEGAAFPEHLVEAVWSWFRWGGSSLLCSNFARPRSKEQLRMLVTCAYQASLRNEEGRPVRFHLLFDVAPEKFVAKFEAPLAYDAGSLVDLAPTIGIGFQWLSVAPRSPLADPLEIVGICDPGLSLHKDDILPRWDDLLFHAPKVRGLMLSVFGPGSMQVIPGAKRVVELRNGSLLLPYSVNRITHIREWYDETAARLGFGATPIGGRLVRWIWGNILRAVSNARHGGCFLVIPEDVDLANMPITIKYRLGADRLQEVLRGRMAVEPGLSQHVHGRADLEISVLDDSHFIERDVARITDLVASLAAVDGAVVLRRDWRLVGFGAEITQNGFWSGDERVEYEQPPDAMDEKHATPLSSLGMRHRSAYRFCQGVPGAMAFVISQDGVLRVFCHTGGRVHWFDSPTPEDFEAS
jgi:hypothetical protein